MSSTGPIPNQGKVVILGGGPAGVSCGMALQRLAQQSGRPIQITIVEGKEFAGERHYNQCVGVLSPPIAALMEKELGIPFPKHLSLREVRGYVLHTDREQITLEGDDQPSLALRRVQFDAYMLDAAKERGVHILPARAVDLEFHDNNVIVYTENTPLQADVVVGAFGLDEGSAAMFARHSAYRPPYALSSVVTKFHPGDAAMNAFGSYIHAFLPRHPEIEFGGITPKGNHLTINIAGKFVDTRLMESFLQLSEVIKVLPNFDRTRLTNPKDLRFFKGRFPSSLAHGYYGDRYVMIGDAAGLVRAFKGKGVTSAIKTGIRAAHTILHSGISARAFDADYRSANQDIIGDLPFGQMMRFLTITFSRWGFLDPILRSAHHSEDMQLALFNAVSGHAPYREILALSLKPQSLLGILREKIKPSTTHESERRSRGEGV
jgi:flavin-dependent dehydrogenase